MIVRRFLHGAPVIAASCGLPHDVAMLPHTPATA